MVEPPPGAPSDAHAFAAGSRATLREGLHRTGAILFRGFAIATADEFGRFVSALGHRADLNYDLEPQARQQSSPLTFESTISRPDEFLLPHTELAYSLTRPAVIAFHCERAADELGETPLFDFQAAFRALPEALRRRFERLRLRYTRRFAEEYVRLKYGGDRAAAEAGCRRAGATYAWTSAGELDTECLVPCVVPHPVSGEPTFHFNTQTYGGSLARAFFLHALKRYRSRVRDVSTRTSDLGRGSAAFEDGTQLDANDERALCEATWAHASVFGWQTGDVLVIDNFKVGHGKLPFRGPRKINAVIGDLVDLRG